MMIVTKQEWHRRDEVKFLVNDVEGMGSISFLGDLDPYHSKIPKLIYTIVSQ
jgi:hypothetical protein